MSFGAWEAVVAVLLVAGAIQVATALYQAARFIAESFHRWGGA